MFKNPDKICFQDFFRKSEFFLWKLHLQKILTNGSKQKSWQNYPNSKLKVTLAPVRSYPSHNLDHLFQSIRTVHFHIFLTNHFHPWNVRFHPWNVRFHPWNVRFHPCLTAKAFWGRSLQSFLITHALLSTVHFHLFLTTHALLRADQFHFVNFTLSLTWTVHFPPRPFTFTSTE